MCAHSGREGLLCRRLVEVMGQCINDALRGVPVAERVARVLHAAESHVICGQAGNGVDNVAPACANKACRWTGCVTVWPQNTN